VQKRRRESQALEHPRAEALDNRVGVGDQLQKSLAILVPLQVERDYALVPADAQPPRSSVANRLAHRSRRVATARALDLDDLSAEIRQQGADARPGDDVRQLEDADASQGKFGRG
jgi:hypothetical protein